ncbi:MAG TPA: hypothetical protein VHB25_13715 [Gemmatimonadaceae bacterium]|nr:hypothetical protein [Gemmatimonadaceae bacterium]
MSQLSTAGRLLKELERESRAIRDTVTNAAGVLPTRADRAMRGEGKLSLAEQLRLAEATLVVAPKLSRQAIRLREQTLATQSYVLGENVVCHRDAPVERWERSSVLRG